MSRRAGIAAAVVLARSTDATVEPELFLLPDALCEEEVWNHDEEVHRDVILASRQDGGVRSAASVPECVRAAVGRLPEGSPSIIFCCGSDCGVVLPLSDDAQLEAFHAHPRASRMRVDRMGAAEVVTLYGVLDPCGGILDINVKRRFVSATRAVWPGGEVPEADPSRWGCGG